MATKQMNIRLDDVHQAILSKLLEAYEASDIKTNKTDLIQRALYSYAQGLLGDATLEKVINDSYKKSNELK